MTLGCRALLIKDQKVLLVRMTYIGGWYLPGGGVDRGENFSEALDRELAEECGIVAEKTKLFGLYLNTTDHRIDHIAVYVVQSFSGEARIVNPNEIAEVAFFPLTQLPERLAAGHRRRIEEYVLQSPQNLNW